MQEDTPFDESEHPLKILVIHRVVGQDPVGVSILIDGKEVLDNCGSSAKACVLLMGLIYSLNLAYPPPLRYTFEVFQKVFLELDGVKLLPKVATLKSKLLPNRA